MSIKEDINFINFVTSPLFPRVLFRRNAAMICRGLFSKQVL